MSDWIRLTVQVPEHDQDLVIAKLTTLGVRGFVQEPENIDAYVPLKAWSTGLQQRIETVCDEAAERTRNRIRFIGHVRVPHQNWNAAWERAAGIVHATKRMVIKPSWKKLPLRDRGKVVLHIDPKMSFGTGHHETTRICLRFLEQFVTRTSTVLDFGTGTGILAIASVKLGARSSVGIDNDPWCMNNARENVKRNRAGRRVRIGLGGTAAIPKRKFSIVVANIDLPTITKAIRRLKSVVVPGGVLLLSGLLMTDVVPLSQMLLQHPGLVPISLIDEGEWIGVALQRR